MIKINKSNGTYAITVIRLFFVKNHIHIKNTKKSNFFDQFNTLICLIFVFTRHRCNFHIKNHMILLFNLNAMVFRGFRILWSTDNSNLKMLEKLYILSL